MLLFHEVLPEGIIVQRRNKLKLKARHHLLVLLASIEHDLRAHSLLLRPTLHLTAFPCSSLLRAYWPEEIGKYLIYNKGLSEGKHTFLLGASHFTS